MQPSKLAIRKQKELVKEIIDFGDRADDIRGYSIYSYGHNILHIHRPEGVGTISSAYLGKIALAPVDVYPETLEYLSEILNEELILS